MATKLCTDLEQSNELKKFLPIESADMCYEFDFDLAFNTKWKSTPIVIEKSNHFELYSQDIPCWSLAVMMDILPIGTESHKQSDGSISYYYVEVYNNKKYFSTKRYDNLVDACVEMVLKLHELNLL
jgi:hypothetical protein